MQKFIAGLTVLSALSVPVYAETPQFPDPDNLPQGGGAEDLPRFPTPDNLPPEITESPNSTNARTYATTTTGNTTQGYYAGPNWSQNFDNWGNNYSNTPRQPMSSNTRHYTPGDYTLPGSMFTPPPPMVLPDLPAFLWSNAENQAGTAQNNANTQTQQIQSLNSTLSGLREQQQQLVSQTQATLSEQEKIIADLKRQLNETRQDKEDLENKLAELQDELAASVKKTELESKLTELQDELATSVKKTELENKLTELQDELATSVKKTELESYKAAREELEGKVTDMSTQVGAIAEISQQFAMLKQNFASLKTEKQQLAAMLEAETKDIDADGIPDKLDLCLETPAGAEVDATGCEPPKDGDSDGVTDENDQCPDTAEGALIDDKGCDLPPPDADKDGIADETDKCPDTREGTKVDEKGCDAIPDEDQDGIADADDLCPGTAADTEANQVGCAKNENINLRGVHFETGSAILTADSLPILDEASETLKKYPDLKIEVGGHTDNTGNAQANEALSQKRAETVMQYLVEKGAQADLLSARGYGSSQAIADNNTQDGRSQNRRVELKILDQ